MSNMNDSKSTKDNIMAICEGVLKGDSISHEIDNKIDALEKELLLSLNASQINLYLKIESLSILQKEHEGVLLYSAGKNHM